VDGGSDATAVRWRESRQAGVTGTADAIAACDCKPSIPRVKAALYLMHRGPD
jgi:hypothetical protein